MKLAVGLFGIHHINGLNHWMGWKTGVDYRETYHNSFEKIYNGHDLRFYGSTYNSPIQHELVKDFNFSYCNFGEIDNNPDSNPVVKRNKIFKNLLKLMLQTATDYELAVLTRFDLHYKQGWSELKIDTNKINFLCGAKCGPDSNLVDDNFYIIPQHLLKSFYEVVETIPEDISSHQYQKYFTDYNLMIDGFWYSHELPFYHIHRKHIH